MPRDLILSVMNISLSFGGNRVLHDVSLDVDRGTLFAIIGPNGAGKTSLFNVLTRLYDPDSGKIAFDDLNLLDFEAADLAGAGVMRTFQNILLLKELTVLENVMLGLHSSHRRSNVGAIFASRGYCAEERVMTQRARDALAIVGLEDSAHKLAGALPFGHRRLLELARCIAAQPKLLLLDEPSAGMTSEEVDRLMVTIEQIRKVLDPTILLIAHTMKLVMRISDRIAVLNYGVKIADDAPKDVAENPLVIEAYLGAEKSHAYS